MIIMKMQIKSITAIAFLVSSAVCAETILYDSFEAAAVGFGLNDAANGEYRSAVGLTHTNNVGVSGGTIIGFASTDIWGGNSSVPQVYQTGLTSSSVSGSGGAVSFRGANDTTKRCNYRTVSAYTGGSSLYFSGTLSATMLDDNALSLIAFTDTANSTRATNILDNTGGFYNGVAFGFKGDGSGGMDLIIRYRSGDLSYVDYTLQSGISANTAYTIAGKIDWNDPGTAGGTRDYLTVWVDPESASEPVSGGTTLLGFLGDPTTLRGVIFAQQNYGTDLSDTIYMDEIRMGSTYADLSIGRKKISLFIF